MPTQNSKPDRLFFSIPAPAVDGDLKDVQEKIQTYLETTLGLTLQEERLYDTTTAHTCQTPLYAEIPNTCPDCSQNLQISEFSDISGNGLMSEAHCPDCNWRGRGQYRLIDLFETPDNPRAGGTRTGLVSQGDVSPTYFCYPDPED